MEITDGDEEKIDIWSSSVQTKTGGVSGTGPGGNEWVDENEIYEELKIYKKKKG